MNEESSSPVPKTAVVTKPCFVCGEPAPVTFDAEAVFEDWSARNRIICDYRARFDGVRERLKWAALDETEEGAHPLCALTWAVTKEGFQERYPWGTGLDLKEENP